MEELNDDVAFKCTNKLPDCQISDVKVVFRSTSNGGNSYFKQCMKCGQTAEKFIAKKNLSIKDLETSIPFNEELEKDYYRSPKLSQVFLTCDKT